MTLAEELAKKYEGDYWTVAPRYRTGERLRQVIIDAINECIERCVAECDAESKHHSDTGEKEADPDVRHAWFSREASAADCADRICALKG